MTSDCERRRVLKYVEGTAIWLSVARRWQCVKDQLTSNITKCDRVSVWVWSYWSTLRRRLDTCHYRCWTEWSPLKWSTAVCSTWPCKMKLATRKKKCRTGTCNGDCDCTQNDVLLRGWIAGYALRRDERRSGCHNWISFRLGKVLHSHLQILFLHHLLPHSQGFALAVQCRVNLGMNVMLSDLREDALEAALNRLRYVALFSGYNVQIQP